MQSLTGRLFLCLTILLAATGCEEMILPSAPSAVADPPAAAPPSGPPAARSAESFELELFYKRVEASLVSQGLLRTDGGGPDVPFTAADLTRNFERIALFEEYADVGGRLVAQQTESRLHRWAQPIRMQVEFGATVDKAKEMRDRAAITGYAARLSRITGLPIRQVTANPNFHIFIVNEQERRALEPRIREIIPGISRAALDTVIDLPKSSYCLVFAWDPDDSGDYEKAVAVIRGEHPDLLRLSCIHEEIAQGMGLANDSPSARPSLFNDDEEFGLLTYHDEQLMKMLYDPRLRPGMTAAEAAPIAAAIAAELMGGES